MATHTAQTKLQLIGKLILSGDLHCETGLHIGAGKGSLEIGGADNPVVKDAFGLPYIPGSSLRGKIRSLLENAIGLLFGRNPGRMERVEGEAIESKSASPARLTVYDAPLEQESITAQMRE